MAYVAIPASGGEDFSGLTNSALVKNSSGDPADAVAGTDYVAPIGPHQTYREIGLALLGLTSAANRLKAWELFEGFIYAASTTSGVSGWTATVASTGAFANQVAGAQAVGQMTTGATATSSADNYTNAAMGHQGTTKWYYAARFKVSTAIDAQARALHMMHSAATGNGVGIGVYGPLDATNFVAYRDGAFGSGTGTKLDLGVAIDTSFHTFEMWCTGDSVLKARIDGGATVTSTQASAAADMYLYHVVRNGTTAAARTMQRRWSYWLVEVS